MQSSRVAVSVALLLAATGLALAQAPTPTSTPVDSNIAVSSFAQSRGQDLNGTPCSTRGDTGCGGCYPNGVPPSDPLAAQLGLLDTVNPEWQAIRPMIPGADASLPPVAVPVEITGTVGLSKSPGDDFPASHLSPDYNAEIIPDDNGLLATGNGNQRVEFEWEADKFPLFAWAGEGDRIIALGRWIFDCGHPDPGPQGRCSGDPTAVCNIDADCASGTCSAPAPNFNYQSEMHPPQAVVVLRNKSIGRRPATRADVYISGDAGGAGDRCTVTHLADPLDVLFTKECFLNHCSTTVARSCLVDADCAKKETCIRLDPSQQLANVNASDFEFDMPLPAQPPGATKVKIKAKKIRIKGVKGSQMPKPTFQVTLSPTPNVHVTVPMTVPVKGQLPSVFAESISAAWKGDKVKLKKVQVRFTSLTINNPVKDSTPAISRQCTDPAGGLTGTACTDDTTCPTGSCAASAKPCHVNADCKPTDFCTGGSRCIGGITPGWRAWAEVNGDWVQFQNLASVGAEAPFLAPPYVQPSTPLTIKEKYRFNEFVPEDGSIHIKASGRSLSCINTALFFGENLKVNLQRLGLDAGAACLLAASRDPGTVDITYTGPDFTTPTGTATTCTVNGKRMTCSATSEGGDGGTCSVTSDRLCVTDADCPAGETCNVTSGAFTLQYTMLVK
ncbi:MAG: hypothetical protein ACE5I7_19165 [Candidatus Binatia bacterium]